MNFNDSPIPVALFGGSGYSGQVFEQLIRSGSEFTVENLSGRGTGSDSPAQSIRTTLAPVVVLALPAEVSLELAPIALRAGKSVIDLSGAFRISPNAFETFYQLKHTETEYLAQAIYGLQPWATIPRHNAQKPTLVSNPGCYATSVLLPLLPLLKNQLVIPDSIVIDSKSGTTGAGKKPSQNLLLSEAADNLTPYRIGNHQHLPEMTETIEKLTGVKTQLTFTPHLMPVRRGILSSIYARVQPGTSTDTIYKLLQKRYSDFDIELRPNGVADLRSVVGTSKAVIGFQVDGDRLYLFSAIDNLMRGAASQAFENLCHLFGKTAHSTLSQWRALV